MRKLSAVSLGLCLTAVISAVFCGCGGKTDKGEFLKEYDASSVAVEQIGGEDIYAGEALFTSMKMTNGENTLNYRIYIPFDLDEENPKPLLLFMHGAGERGTDNERQISAYKGLDNLLNSESPLLDYIIIAPQCPPGETWMSFPEGVSHGDGIYSVDTAKPGKAMSSALTLVKYYNEKSYVVKDKQFVMGISMGGFATWDIITRHSDVFAAAIPICGGCDVTKAETLKNVPIYTFHGVLDPLVSPKGTQTMVKNIKESGGDKIIYVEYADGYHDIWNDALSTESLAEWINSESLSDR